MIDAISNEVFSGYTLFGFFIVIILWILFQVTKKVIGTMISFGKSNFVVLTILASVIGLVWLFV